MLARLIGNSFERLHDRRDIRYRSRADDVEIRDVKLIIDIAGDPKLFAPPGHHASVRAHYSHPAAGGSRLGREQTKHLRAIHLRTLRHFRCDSTRAAIELRLDCGDLVVNTPDLAVHMHRRSLLRPKSAATSRSDR